jgi:hypothetical protein
LRCRQSRRSGALSRQNAGRGVGRGDEGFLSRQRFLSFSRILSLLRLLATEVVNRLRASGCCVRECRRRRYWRRQVGGGEAWRAVTRKSSGGRRLRRRFHSPPPTVVAAPCCFGVGDSSHRCFGPSDSRGVRASVAGDWGTTPSCAGLVEMSKKGRSVRGSCQTLRRERSLA